MSICSQIKCWIPCWNCITKQQVTSNFDKAKDIVNGIFKIKSFKNFKVYKRNRVRYWGFARRVKKERHRIYYSLKGQTIFQIWTKLYSLWTSFQRNKPFYHKPLFFKVNFSKNWPSCIYALLKFTGDPRLLTF